MKLSTLLFTSCRVLALATVVAAGAPAARGQSVTGLLPAPNTLAARATNVAATLPATPPASATTALRVFSQQSGGQKRGTTTVSGNAIRFDPAVDFKPGETVTATLTAAAGAPARVWQFTAAATGGTGVFGHPTTTISDVGGFEVADLDNDGDLDVISLELTAAHVFLNTGTGQLMARDYISVGRDRVPLLVKPADMNGDGSLDLVVYVRSETAVEIAVYRNNGAGAFTLVSSVQPADLSPRLGEPALGDVDGDGDLDLLYTLSAATAQLLVRLNDGTGVLGAPFSQVSAPASSGAVARLILGDVDKDGDLDVVRVTNAATGAYVYLNTGTGVFAAPASYQASTYSGGLALGDLDGDTDLDLAVPLFQFNPTINLLLNSGNGTFTPGPAVGAGSGVSALRSVTVGDVNGDNSPDLVVAGSGIGVLLNTGTGTFIPQPNSVFSTNQYDAVQLVDMDGDGDLDIITKGSGTGDLYVSLNQNLVTSTRAGTEAAFQVWPNPTASSDGLHLRLPAAAGAAKAELRTLLGQLVREHTFSGSTAELTTSGLASGTYLLSVQPVGQLPSTRRILVR